MKKIKFYKRKKIFLFLLFFLALIFLPGLTFGQGAGDVIWWKEPGGLGPGDEQAYGVAVDSTGVYVVGSQSDGIWRVEKRRLTDGFLLWGEPSVGGIAKAVAIDSTGGSPGVYVVGSGGPFSWRVEKRDLVTGIVLWEKEVVDLGAYNEARAVAVDSTGVYVAGTKDSCIWRVEKRRLTDGSLIWKKEENFSGGCDLAGAVAVDSTGVYVAGTQSGFSIWRVEKRRLTDGSLLWEKNESLGGGKEMAMELAVDSAGVYVVGYQDSSDTWRVEKRRLTDGSLIWKKEEDLSGGNDIARGVGISSTGVYISGSQNNDSIWRVEKRSLIDGSLLWKKEEDFTAGKDWANEAGFYSNALYIVGAQANNQIWRVEKRADPLPPTVVTNDATEIQDTSVTLKGNITNTGGENCDERGFEWGTSSGSYPNTWTKSGSFGTGAFSHTITGLNPETKYYFRAKARNSADWGYGSEKSFKTAASPLPPCEYHNVWGYAWSDNIGWISFSCKDIAGTIDRIRVRMRFQGTIKTYLRLNGAESMFPGSGSVGGGWADRFTAWQPSRPGGGSWTWDDIKNLQVVAGLSAWTFSGKTYQGRLTQIYIEIDDGGSILTLRPDNDGDYINIEKPPVGSHWDLVDDVIADDFGTYVWTDSGSEQKDAYNLQDPSAAGSTVNYGVDIDETTGEFSGYAWSDSIGWISFNSGDLAGCPSAPCEARLDLDGTTCGAVGQVCGWARALAYGGGWDGWIKLRGTVEPTGGPIAMMTEDEISKEVFGLEYDDFLEVAENHPESPIDVSVYSSLDVDKLRDLTNLRIPGTNTYIYLSYISVPKGQANYKKQTVYGTQTGYGEEEEEEEEEESEYEKKEKQIIKAVDEAKKIYTSEMQKLINQADILILDKDDFVAKYIENIIKDLEAGRIGQETADFQIGNMHNIAACVDYEGNIIMNKDGVIRAMDKGLEDPIGTFVHEYAHVVDHIIVDGKLEHKYSSSPEYMDIYNRAVHYYIWEKITPEDPNVPKATNAGFVSEYATSFMFLGLAFEDFAETVRVYQKTGGDPSKITDDIKTQELIQERFNYLEENGIVNPYAAWLMPLNPFDFNIVRAQLSPFDFDIVQVQLTQANGSSSGGSYGVSLNPAPTPSEFREWAWGSDVIGWISFNCLDTGACGDSDYKVMTDITITLNNIPSATNLSREQTSGCGSAPIVRFSWDYSDDDNVPPGTDPQSAYEIQIDDAGGLITTLSGGAGTSRDYSPPSFGTTYWWRVRVRDTNGPAWSGWTDGPNFTPTKWPDPDFTWCPLEPDINETIQFCSVFEAGVCDQAAEPSCSDMTSSADNLTTCAAGCNLWEWDFDNDGTPEITSTDNPTYSYSSSGDYRVRLTVTDVDGRSCFKQHDVSADIPLPIWKEIPPF